jgi:hypothetical protein
MHQCYFTQSWPGIFQASMVATATQQLMNRQPNNKENCMPCTAATVPNPSPTHHATSAAALLLAQACCCPLWWCAAMLLHVALVVLHQRCPLLFCTGRLRCCCLTAALRSCTHLQQQKVGQALQA